MIDLRLIYDATPTFTFISNFSLNVYRLLLPLFLIFSLIACSRGGSNQQGGFDRSQFQRGTSVQVTDIQRSSISDVVRAYGNIQSQDQVRISPQISERVSRIHADLGDTVRVGSLLAELRDINFVDQVRRDESQLRQARSAVVRDSLEFARAQSLFERDLASSSELENARVGYQTSISQYESARAALTQSRENLQFTLVRSPVDGVITSRTISPGDLASTGSVMFEISNLVGYEMRLFLPLTDRRKVRNNHEVNIRLTGEQHHSARGVVSRISPGLDPITGLAEVVVSLTDTDSLILPGSLGEASIIVQTNPESIVVPRNALVENVQTVLDPETNTIRINRGYNAFIAQGDSVAVLRELELGLQQGDRIEVLSGLSEGDRLIITGQGGLENNSRINVAGTRQRPAQGDIPISENGSGEGQIGQPQPESADAATDSDTSSNESDE